MKKYAEKPSSELKRLIEIANLVPLKPESLPNFKYLTAKFYFEKTGKVFPQTQFSLHHRLDVSVFPTREEQQAHRKSQENAFEEVKKITRKYPPLYRYIFDTNAETAYTIDSKPDWFQQILRYEYILSIQKILVHAAIDCTVFTEEFGIEKFAKGSFKGHIEIYLPAEYIIENGRLHFVLADITKTLEGIDVRRLKMCKECESVFWAYRLDARYCSNECGNLKRVKEFQKKAKAKDIKKRKEREEWKSKDFSKK